MFNKYKIYGVNVSLESEISEKTEDSFVSEQYWQNVWFIVNRLFLQVFIFNGPFIKTHTFTIQIVTHYKLSIINFSRWQIFQLLSTFYTLAHWGLFPLKRQTLVQYVICSELLHTTSLAPTIDYKQLQACMHNKQSVLQKCVSLPRMFVKRTN